MSFRTISRNLLIAAAILVVCSGLLSAFSAGFVGELQRRSLDPRGAGTARAELLEDIRRAAGYSGAAGVLESYAETNNTDDIARATWHIRQAEAAANQYKSQEINQQQRQTLEKLEGTLASISDMSKILKAGGTGFAPLQRLSGLVRRMEEQVSSLHRFEVMVRLDAASTVTSFAETVILVVLLSMVVVFLCLALIIRLRMQSPLEQLSHFVHDISVAIDTGKAVDGPVWGSERQDEIGMMARAADRLRRSVTQQVRLQSKPSDGTVSVALSGPSGHILDQILEKLRGASEDLIDRGRSFDEAGNTLIESVRSQEAKIGELTGDLQKTQKGLDESVSTARNNFKSGFEVLSSVSSRLQEMDDEIRNATGTMIDRATEKFDSFLKVADGSLQKVEVTLRTMTANQSEMTALTDETRKSSEHLVKFVDTAREQVTKTVSGLQSHCATVESQIAGIGTELKDAAADVHVQRESLITGFKTLDESLKSSVDSVGAQTGSIVSAVESAKSDVAQSCTEFKESIEKVSTDARSMTDTFKTVLDTAKGHDVAIETAKDVVAASLAKLTEVGTMLSAYAEKAAQLAEGHDADTQKVSKTLETHVGALGELVRQAGTAVHDSLSELKKDSGTLSEASEVVARMSNGLSDNLTQMLGKFGKALDEQDVKNTTLARQHVDIQERLERIGNENSSALSEIQSILSSSQSNSLTMVSALQKVIEKLEAIGETVTASAGSGDAAAVSDTVLPQLQAVQAAMTDVLEEVRGLTGTVSEKIEQATANTDQQSAVGNILSEAVLPQIDSIRAIMTDLVETAQTLPDRIKSDIEQINQAGDRESDIPDQLAQAVLPEIETVRTELARLLEAAQGLPGEVVGALEQRSSLAEGSQQREADQDAGRQLQDLRDVVEAANTGLTARLDALSDKVSQAPAVDNGIDVSSLIDVSQRIEDTARSVFERLNSMDAPDVTSLQAVDEQTSDLNRTLARFAEDLGHVANGGSNDLHKATKDIRALTEVIDILEQRSSDLARRMTDMSSEEANSNTPMDPADYQDTESAITALTEATEKLGNIATAVAIASDANRVPLAG